MKYPSVWSLPLQVASCECCGASAALAAPSGSSCLVLVCTDTQKKIPLGILWISDEERGNGTGAKHMAAPPFSNVHETNSPRPAASCLDFGTKSSPAATPLLLQPIRQTLSSCSSARTVQLCYLPSSTYFPFRLRTCTNSFRQNQNSS